MSFIEADIFKVIHIIRDTPSNTSGIIDLSPTVNSFLAYPGSVNNGHGKVFFSVYIIKIRNYKSCLTVSYIIEINGKKKLNGINENSEIKEILVVHN